MIIPSLALPRETAISSPLWPHLFYPASYHRPITDKSVPEPVVYPAKSIHSFQVCLKLYVLLQ